ncbi:hypothetical protein RchiOBHm_Chr6g0270281 [Rosa chinensis]|uniref:Uncharacterized protein n=1 Tax=Rosa chinensis TaxID=74649 RepID=A0A2P6PQN3_ROSCH|nr:hypothetical protein RchiOBHm_Chr6g0270281 [Rosa chinensis]
MMLGDLFGSPLRVWLREEVVVGMVAEGVEDGVGLGNVGDGAGHGGNDFGVGEVGHLAEEDEDGCWGMINWGWPRLCSPLIDCWGFCLL